MPRTQRWVLAHHPQPASPVQVSQVPREAQTLSAGSGQAYTDLANISYSHGSSVWKLAAEMEARGPMAFGSHSRVINTLRGFPVVEQIVPLEYSKITPRDLSGEARTPGRAGVKKGPQNKTKQKKKKKRAWESSRKSRKN